MAWWGRTEIWGGDMEKKPRRGREEETRTGIW
jgi:hypothetical protein